eukprot:515921-Alexandrium_andersonii.AAC.1
MLWGGSFGPAGLPRALPALPQHFQRPSLVGRLLAGVVEDLVEVMFRLRPGAAKAEVLGRFPSLSLIHI